MPLCRLLRRLLQPVASIPALLPALPLPPFIYGLASWLAPRIRRTVARHAVVNIVRG